MKGIGNNQIINLPATTEHSSAEHSAFFIGSVDQSGWISHAINEENDVDYWKDSTGTQLQLENDIPGDSSSASSIFTRGASKVTNHEILPTENNEAERGCETLDKCTNDNASGHDSNTLSFDAADKDHNQMKGPLNVLLNTLKLRHSHHQKKIDEFSELLPRCENLHSTDRLGIYSKRFRNDIATLEGKQSESMRYCSIQNKQIFDRIRINLAHVNKSVQKLQKNVNVIEVSNGNELLRAQESTKSLENILEKVQRRLRNRICINDSIKTILLNETL